MYKVAVVAMNGFEEAETLTIVDILRRANIKCDIVGETDYVVGGHNIKIKIDKILSSDIEKYDMIVLPGGYGGVESMISSDLLKEIVTNMNKANKYICAMCAAPLFLSTLNLLENKKFTSYKGYDKKINQGNYLEDIVVIDSNIITSRGPATVYEFSYKLTEILKADVNAIKDRMLYYNAFDKKEVK